LPFTFRRSAGDRSTGWIRTAGLHSATRIRASPRHAWPTARWPPR